MEEEIRVMLRHLDEYTTQRYLVILFIVAFLFLYPSAILGQTRIWLQEKETSSSEISMRFLDIRDIEIWVDIGSINCQGTAFYINFDPTVFQISDLGTDPRKIQPLDFTSGFFGDNGVENNLNNDHIDGSVIMMSNNYKTGSGKVARFRITAKTVTPQSIISIVYDRGNHRDTRYHVLNNGSQPYSVRGNLIVRVIGLELSEVPDVFLAPGGQDTSIVLYKYLHNVRLPVNQLVYQATGGNGNVSASINPATSRVTLQARANYKGREKIAFSVTEGGFMTTDTILVNITYPPHITGLPATIIFPEDGQYESPLFTQIVTDQDDDPSTIVFSGKIIEGPMSLEFSTQQKKFYVTAVKDYNGPGKIRIYATDPYGAVDSLTEPVVVTPINDPPVITKIGTYSIAPNKADSSLILNDHVIDVDNSKNELKWTVTGGTHIQASLLAGNNYRVIFKPETGFLGSETFIFRVQDPSGSFNQETVLVLVRRFPPVVQGLPDAVLCSSDSLIHNFVDLDNYVTDQDNPINSLSWSSSGDSAITTAIASDHFVKFKLRNINQRGWERRIFTARDPDGNDGSDTIFVVAVRRGYPTIGDIPDVVVPAGHTDSSLVLDNYVWLCGLTKNELTWSVSGQKKITVVVNPSTRRVYLTAQDTTFIGDELLTFRATAPGGADRYDEDKMWIHIVPAGDAPFLTPFNPIQVTKRRPAVVNLGEHLFIFPDSLRRYVSWSIEGSNPVIGIEIDQLRQIATLTLLDENFLGDVTFTITARNLLNNKTFKQTLTAKVTRGKAPVLGDIPDVSFISGEISASINLDLYVRDEDTPDSNMLWEVTGNKNVTVKTERLRRGADHILELSNKPGFIGAENLILTVEDPEGNFDQDTITVFVRFISEFDITVIPNPIVGEYIDIIVYASDSLRESPVVSIVFNKQKEYLPVSRVPGALIWKSDYIFPQKSSGAVAIIATGINWLNKTLIDTTLFTAGSLHKSSSLVLSQNDATLSLSKNSVDKSTTVLLIHEDINDVSHRNYAKPDTTQILFFISGYWLGPTEMTLNTPGRLQLHFSSLPDYLRSWEKVGLYSGAYGQDNPQFLSGISNEGNVDCAIQSFGYYFVAADQVPPVINRVNVTRGEMGMVFSPDIKEIGSGYDGGGVQAYLKGKPLSIVYQADKQQFLIPFTEFRGAEPPIIVNLSVSDRAGNVSKIMDVLLEKNDVSVPDEYKLFQNYPNPFNPVTIIRFQIPGLSDIQIKIYNILGQEIKTLINKKLPGGSFEVQWDGTNNHGQKVSSGVYICSMETPGFRQNKKMMLVK